MGGLVIALLVVSPLISADPIVEAPRSCTVLSPAEAKASADAFYERGDFQDAGKCYEAAGDPSRAQLAYLKAVRPNAEVAARDLEQQRNAARAQLAQLQQAFRTHH